MVLVKSSITGKEATRMRYSNQGWFREQASFLRRQYLQDGDLPFSNVLSEEVVAQALAAISACWLDRIYSPLITLWVFSKSGPESRPFLPRGSCAVNRSPGFAGAMSLLCRDWRLLPGQKASARNVLLERSPSNRTCVREKHQSPVAMESPPRLRL